VRLDGKERASRVGLPLRPGVHVVGLTVTVVVVVRVTVALVIVALQVGVGRGALGSTGSRVVGPTTSARGHGVVLVDLLCLLDGKGVAYVVVLCQRGAIEV
jgi:hypothetical protein